MIDKQVAVIGGISFEGLKRQNAYGAEYWSSRDLQPLLGYSSGTVLNRPLSVPSSPVGNRGTSRTTILPVPAKWSSWGLGVPGRCLIFTLYPAMVGIRDGSRQ